MRAFLALVFGSLLIAACGAGPETSIEPTTSTVHTTTTTSTPATAPADEHAQARALWRDAGLKTYRYTFEDDCGECAASGPIDVTVWERLASRHDVATIEQMFDAIDSAINEHAPIEVSYDSEFGYPTEVWIDREARAYDGGTHLLVHEFEPGLPTDSSNHGALVQARGVWELNRPDAYELEMQIVCGCEFDGIILATVEGNRVVDWDATFNDGVGGDISAITIDQMFDDLDQILASSDGYVLEGAKYRGFVQYDRGSGYPNWVGLEIDILEQTSENALLPELIVTSITRLEPVESTDE